MSETYQVYVKPGFTGGSEGHEFVQYTTKNVGRKPVVSTDKQGWVNYAMFPCASKAEVKKAIRGILKSSKGFWGDKSDVWVSIEDNTKQFYASGEFNTKTNPSEADWDGFVQVEIHFGSKKPESSSKKPNVYTPIAWGIRSDVPTRSQIPTKSAVGKGLSAKDLYSALSSGSVWGKK
jgi:hypothetical protein